MAARKPPRPSARPGWAGPGCRPRQAFQATPGAPRHLPARAPPPPQSAAPPRCNAAVLGARQALNLQAGYCTTILTLTFMRAGAAAKTPPRPVSTCTFSQINQTPSSLPPLKNRSGYTSSRGDLPVTNRQCNLRPLSIFWNCIVDDTKLPGSNTSAVVLAKRPPVRWHRRYQRPQILPAISASRTPPCSSKPAVERAVTVATPRQHNSF